MARGESIYPNEDGRKRKIVIRMSQHHIGFFYVNSLANPREKKIKEG